MSAVVVPLATVGSFVRCDAFGNSDCTKLNEEMERSKKCEGETRSPKFRLGRRVLEKEVAQKLAWVRWCHALRSGVEK